VSITGAGGLVGSDGWVDDTADTWTYASADSPTFTFTITGVDRTGVLTPGKRIKLTQTTVKYFIVTASSFGGGNTTVTIYGGTTYTLANAAISSNFHSFSKAPDGFPLDPAGWTVEVTDSSLRSQASPVAGTWYNPGSVTISVPIGCWRIYYEVSVQGQRATTGQTDVTTTLSTANNSQTDSTMSAENIANNSTTTYATFFRERFLTVATKTSYFLNITTSLAISSIAYRGDLETTIIRAVCAYL